ncbi:IS66 family insertion sequence element accessory protein TnpB [Pseudomonas juntendi]|uniref:IS66 family insertion sequence element accessory protein TnpB n=1 Tax=Pseudomonas juntendi TaxID=2666183 RepID=UPI003D35E6B6
MAVSGSPLDCCPDGHARWYRNLVNRRANRMSVLVHDGVGICLAARRLNQYKFHWLGIRDGAEVEFDSEQIQVRWPARSHRSGS